MPEYKFYPINDQGHVAARPVVVKCPHDLAAIHEGRKLLDARRIDGRDVEVWEGPRIVGYLTSDTPAPDPA